MTKIVKKEKRKKKWCVIGRRREKKKRKLSSQIETYKNQLNNEARTEFNIFFGTITNKQCFTFVFCFFLL